MDFIHTQIGKEICNKASRLLGMHLAEKKQYTVCTDLRSCCSAIDAELKAGARFVDKIYDGTGTVVIIFEKKE